MSRRDVWSKEDIELLGIYRRNGLPYNEIAKKLHRTEGAVMRAITRFGLAEPKPKPVWTEEQLKCLVAMAKEGAGIKRIAKSVNHSYNSTREKLAKYGYHRINNQEDFEFRTLCWTCKRSTGRNMCSWALNFKPVDGWKTTNGDVIECPSFDEEESISANKRRVRKG